MFQPLPKVGMPLTALCCSGPGLKHFQGWGMHSSPGQPVPDPISSECLWKQSTPRSSQQCFGNVLSEKLCKSRGTLPPTCPGWHKGGMLSSALLPGHMQFCLCTHIHTQVFGIQTTWKPKSNTQLNLNSAVCLNYI